VSRLQSGRWLAFLIGVGLVSIITCIGLLLRLLPVFELAIIDILYVLIVAISAAYLGVMPSILVSFLSVFACDFFFINPIYSVTVASEKDSFNLLILFVVAIFISLLSPKLRR
jgi:two-component system sensor histidine kinase KdpD